VFHIGKASRAGGRRFAPRQLPLHLGQLGPPRLRERPCGVELGIELPVTRTVLCGGTDGIGECGQIGVGHPVTVPHVSPEISTIAPGSDEVEEVDG